MAKTFTQKVAGWFGIGRVSEDIRLRLMAESEIEYLAEGIWQTAIYSNFGAPGQYASSRRMGFVGYVAMSHKRLVARAGGYNRVDINMAFGDRKFGDVIWMLAPGYVSLAFDAASHIPGASGRIEVRLHVPDAAELASKLVARGVNVGSKH
jgi:hypothetical protein